MKPATVREFLRRTEVECSTMATGTDAASQVARDGANAARFLGALFDAFSGDAPAEVPDHDRREVGRVITTTAEVVDDD